MIKKSYSAYCETCDRQIVKDHNGELTEVMAMTHANMCGHIVDVIKTIDPGDESEDKI